VLGDTDHACRRYFLKLLHASAIVSALIALLLCPSAFFESLCAVSQHGGLNWLHLALKVLSAAPGFGGSSLACQGVFVMPIPG
jgi:hypothetical protein